LNDQQARWVKILSKTHPTIAFHASINNSFGKGSLIQLLRQFSTLFSDKKQISVGFIGYPNVGKSSIINTLKKKAVCKTAPIPGETKVWQYITLMRRIYLIDCPGIVPPSARETESQKVLKGVVRVEHLSSPSDHITLLLERVRPEYLSRTYGVKDWTDTEDFLAKLAAKMGKLHRGGEADHRTVATIVLNVRSSFNLQRDLLLINLGDVHLLQDWIRGKIPYFIAPPEPDHRDASGKLLPRPIKVAVEVAASAVAAVKSLVSSTKKSTASGGTNSLSGGTDALGNSVRNIKGVTQPLHQIVRSTKFLADDEAHVAEEEEEEDEVVDVALGADVVDEDEEEEEEDGDWDGIDSDDEDDMEGEEGESFDTGLEESINDSEVPLQWEDLFDQAVGEAEAEETNAVAGPGPKTVKKAAVASKAVGKKRSTLHHFLSSTPLSSRHFTSVSDFLFDFFFCSARVVGEDDLSFEASPEKAPRMKTNKKAATNFFSTANVKNKNRDKVAPQARGVGGKTSKGQGSGKKRGGRKVNA
jgi:nuclear GTP-binding protein